MKLFINFFRNIDEIYMKLLKTFILSFNPKDKR